MCHTRYNFMLHLMEYFIAHMIFIALDRIFYHKPFWWSFTPFLALYCRIIYFITPLKEFYHMMHIVLHRTLENEHLLTFLKYMWFVFLDTQLEFAASEVKTNWLLYTFGLVRRIVKIPLHFSQKWTCMFDHVGFCIWVLKWTSYLMLIWLMDWTFHD